MVTPASEASVAPAPPKAEAVRLGEVVGAHQRDEVGVSAVLEHLARSFGLGIIAILLLRFEFAVQRNAGHTLLRSQAPQRVQGAVDFTPPWHEDEDVQRS